MGRMKVRDMPRNQQKAVFASMTDDKYMARLESAEMYHRRRSFLRKKHDLAEDTEDRIMDVWNDRKLTYRQKMSKIGKIKAEAQKKLEAHKRAETALTVAGAIRKENWKRFQREAHPTSITNVPEGKDRAAFNTIISERKLPSESLYAHKGLLLTQQEYVGGLKNNARKLPKGSTVAEQPRGSRRAFDAHMFNSKPKEGHYVRVDGVLVKQSVYRKALRRNARVRYPSIYKREISGKKPKDFRVKMKMPAVGSEKEKWEKSEPMTFEEARALAKEKHKLGWDVKVVDA